jgi:hypothetical protein
MSNEIRVTVAGKNPLTPVKISPVYRDIFSH